MCDARKTSQELADQLLEQQRGGWRRALKPGKDVPLQVAKRCAQFLAHVVGEWAGSCCQPAIPLNTHPSPHRDHSWCSKRVAELGADAQGRCQRREDNEKSRSRTKIEGKGRAAAARWCPRCAQMEPREKGGRFKTKRQAGGYGRRAPVHRLTSASLCTGRVEPRPFDSIRDSRGSGLIPIEDTKHFLKGTN
jgi:hypothetical protein